MSEPSRSYPGHAELRQDDATERQFLEDNIATVAFHLGQPGAKLSVRSDKDALTVDPGEVLKEISRRLTVDPAQGSPDPLKQPQYIVEGIILRRLHEKRIEGYTLEMSKEIAGALSLSSTQNQTAKD